MLFTKKAAASAVAKLFIFPVALSLAACGGGGGADAGQPAAQAEATLAAEAASPVADSQVTVEDAADPGGPKSAITHLSGAELEATADIGAPAATGAAAESSEAIATVTGQEVAAGATDAAAAQASTDGSDSAPTPNQSARAVIAASGGNYTITNSTFRRLYGPGVYVIDSLGNLNVGVVGGRTYAVSHRFRASASGSVSSIRPYWAAGSGYSAGTGGYIRVRILPDDGSSAHRPNLNATALATGYHRPYLSNGRLSGTAFNTPVSMSSSQSLQAGTLYHIVYENIDSNPAANYIGVNHAATASANGRPSRWLSPYDWGTLYTAQTRGSSYSWSDIAVGTTSSGNYYVPIVQINLSNGTIIGNANMETGNEDSRQWQVTSSAPVRERFTSSSTRQISGFGVHTSPSRGGSLQWQLKQGSRVLASGTIYDGSASYRTSSSLGHSTGVFAWRDVSFSSPVTLSAGTTYDLEFTGQGSSVWRFADQRNGAAYGYAWSAAFTQSQAQAYTNGSWLNANHWTKSASTAGSNWRVVLYADY